MSAARQAMKAMKGLHFFLKFRLALALLQICIGEKNFIISNFLY